MAGKQTAGTRKPVFANIIAAPVFLEVLPAGAYVRARGQRFRRTENGSFECLTDPTCPPLTATEMPRAVEVISVPAYTYSCGCTDHACTAWGCGNCHKRTVRRPARKTRQPA